MSEAPQHDSDGSAYDENNKYYFDTQIIFSSLVFIVFITDLVLSTLFIVGGHKKNVKLLRIYYVYSIALCLLTILFTTVIVGIQVEQWTTYEDKLSVTSCFIRALDFTGYFVNIAIQAYFVLLLRNEIMKLTANCQVRFTNIAAASESTMKYAELAEQKKGTEHLYT